MATRKKAPKKAPKKAKSPKTAKSHTASKAAKADSSASAARLVDARLAAIGGWRGDLLTRIRGLIRDADPEVVESIKWRKPTNPAGVPVWEHGGVLCTGEVYAGKVKLTFANGAALPDPAHLFNASLDGGMRRAIDLREGERVDERAFTALVRAAVALNVGRRGTK